MQNVVRYIVTFLCKKYYCEPVSLL